MGHLMKNGLSGLMLTLALALLMGCPASSSGTGSVQLAVSVPQPLVSSVSRVSVTFSAEGAPSFSVELLAANGSWRGFLSNLPAGNNRTFLAQAFDASGAKLFEGSASGVTLFADQTAWVAVSLQRVDAPPPFQNAAPIIDSLAASSTSVMEGSALTLVASAHDPNAGDRLSYAWTSTAGSFSPSTEATTAWTAPDSAGLQTLTLTVTDPGGLTSRLALTIHVLPSEGHGEAQFSILFNNAPEVMTLSAAPTRLTAGQATAVSASASDMDGDTLSYAWSASCEGTWSNASSRSAQFTPSMLPQASCNNCRLTVTVSDERGGQTTGTVALCVLELPAPQHFPPFFTSATRSSESATSGQVLTFDVSASDPQDSALSFSWSATLGTLGTPASTASSSRVAWTAPQCVSDGSAPVLTATVTNAFGLASTVRFTVPGLPATCQRLPPRLSSVSPAHAKAGTLVTLTGADFVPGITGRIGSTSCTSTVFVSSTSATCTMPTLANGTYAITVIHPDGLSSTLAAALLYDSTPPAGGGTLNDGIASNSLTTSPTLAWTAFTDAGSGLDHYEYALGTTLGGTQVRDWTVFTPNAGPSFTLTGLTLTVGATYYPSIRAYDRAGNFTTRTGNGWVVDTTAPQAPTALNDGTVTSAASASPIAFWTASTDVGSGIARYELAIGSSAGGTDLLTWTSVGNVTSASLPGLTLSPGMTYYTSVRAADHAGNVSAATLGDGWTYALQGPTTLVFMPMDHAGPTTSDNSSVEFVNFANAGAHLLPVQNPSISTVAPKYGAGSGAFQNGSLQTGSSIANAIGNSDFTIEFWVKHSSLGFFGSPVISGSGWDISLGNTGYNNSADFAYGNQSARHWGGAIGWGVLSANVWNHLSISRSGTTLYTHLNGVLKQTVTIAAGARLEGTATASTLTVGGHPSYIDDLRITVGGVTHTAANFTPTQLTPLPFLYLPMDGPGGGELPTADFRNMVPGGVSLSASGAPLIPPAASACGGCGDFTAGTLSTPVSAATTLGTRDFTLEFWVKHSSLDSGNSPVLSGGNGTTTFWDISLGNTVFNGNANFAFYATQMGGNRGWGGDISWGVLPLDTWTHLSLTRKGTSLITHKNGILVETVTILATDKMEGPNTTSAITIGGYPASLDDVMLTVGAARHTTANFPVARVPYTPRPVTVEPHVLLPLDGANGSTAFPNFAANGVTFSAVAAPAITTAAARYGGASGNFQSGSLTTATTSGNVIGTRDFTIEFWVNFSALSGVITPVVAGNGWMLSLGNTDYNNTATFTFANQSAPWWGGPVGWGVLSRNTWTHLAVSRFQDRLYTHKNGVLTSVISIAPTAHMEGGATTSALKIGQSPSYLDDVQITLGSAKYTPANFSVAPQLTRPFMHFPMDGANLSASFPNHGTGPAVTPVDSPTLTTTGALHGGASANFTAGSLTTAASSGYRLGTQDFTIEFWVKNPALGLTGSPVIYGSGWDISLGNWGYNNNADFAYYPTENSGYRHWGGDIGWGVLPLNTWVHLSLSRTGTSLYTHKNGVLVSTLTIPATAAMEGPNATSAIVIGGHPSYVDDLQVTIGKARHTRANFNVFP